MMPSPERVREDGGRDKEHQMEGGMEGHGGTWRDKEGQGGPEGWRDGETRRDKEGLPGR
jgi:hypothetical protein